MSKFKSYYCETTMCLGVRLVLFTPAPFIVSPKIWRLNGPSPSENFKVAIVRSEPLSFSSPSARVVIRSLKSHLVESELAVIDGILFEDVPSSPALDRTDGAFGTIEGIISLSMHQNIYTLFPWVAASFSPSDLTSSTLGREGKKGSNELPLV